jgi:hypothetical protein
MSGSMNNRRLIFKSLDEALSELGRLTRAEALQPAPAWNSTQTLNHRAQSVEYSMTGFPQAKSQVCQRTVGTIAFKVFSWRGRMTHWNAPTLRTTRNESPLVMMAMTALEGGA